MMANEKIMIKLMNQLFDCFEISKNVASNGRANFIYISGIVSILLFFNETNKIL